MLIADAYINLSLPYAKTNSPLAVCRLLPSPLPTCPPASSLLPASSLWAVATPGQQQMPRTPQYLRCQSVLRINRLQQQQHGSNCCSGERDANRVAPRLATPRRGKWNRKRPQHLPVIVGRGSDSDSDLHSSQESAGRGRARWGGGKANGASVDRGEDYKYPCAQSASLPPASSADSVTYAGATKWQQQANWFQLQQLQQQQQQQHSQHEWLVTPDLCGAMLLPRCTAVVAASVAVAVAGLWLWLWLSAVLNWLAEWRPIRLF